MGFLVKIAAKVLVNGLALFLLAKYLPGFALAGDMRSLAIAALTVTAVHLVLRPVLRLISLPFLILTLGLFNIVINLVLLYAADRLSAAFEVEGFLAYLVASAILGIINSII